MMLQLSQGRRPARPKSRPIQDDHWALVEQCWAPIDQRPGAEDVASLLQDFLCITPISRPLCDLLRDIHTSSKTSLSLPSTISDSSGDEHVVFDISGPNEAVSSLIDDNPDVFRSLRN